MPSYPRLDRTQIGLLEGLTLTTGGLTHWDVPIVDDELFHSLIAGSPSGFSDAGEWGSSIWYQPDAGGVAVVFDKAAASHKPLRSSDIVPNPILQPHRALGELDLLVGETPGTRAEGDNQSNFIMGLRKHLGLLVLAHVPDVMTVIQLPGADNYDTAYAVVNGGQKPLIRPDMQNPGFKYTKKFLEGLAAGRWPGDMHFFESHALTLIAGGPVFAQRIITMAAACMSDERLELHKRRELTGNIDVVSTLALYWATARVRAYRKTGMPDTLYSKEQLDRSRMLPDRELRNRAVLASFNEFVARYLDVALPIT